MNRESPFEEWYHVLVPSSHGNYNGKNRYYRVSCGSSTWREADPGKIHKSYVVFIQFGNTENYEDAKRNREIVFDYPSHILEEDLDKVMEAIKELQNK